MDRTARRIPLPYLLVPFAASALAGYAADATWATLVNHHPLFLIALSARNRYLLAAATHISITPFFVVGFLRLVLTDPIAFVLGRQYGEAAIGWVDKKTTRGEGGSLVRQMETWFDKASAVFIIVAPSFIWCVMAGASRMRTWVFITCNLVGTIGRLILIWVVGDVFSRPLRDALRLVERYRWPILAVSIATVVVQVLQSRRAGVLESPAEMEEELEEIEDEIDASPERSEHE